MRPARPGLPLLLALTLCGANAPDRAMESSVRLLRRTVTAQRDGSHLVLLTSLRQLGDPTLRPLFLQLAQHGDPDVRIHAILGLAELDEEGRVDPWLISQLDTPEARLRAIENALVLKLIDTPQINELLGWADLGPESRVLLMAEQASRGETPDPKVLSQLAGHPDLDVAALAASLLAQSRDDTAFAAYRKRVKAVPAAERARHFTTVFRTVARYELTAALDWIVEVLQQQDLHPTVRAQGISTLLTLDTERGVALWTLALGSDPPYGECVRYALVLLGSGPTVSPAAYDRLPRGDRVLDGMADAGKAVSTGQNTAAALIELLDVGHPGATQWVMATAERLPPDQATPIYMHLIETAEEPTAIGEDKVELSFLAAARLFEIDPDWVFDRLQRADDDSLTQQAILMGLLESRSPRAGEAARGLKRIGYGRADSLALILIAKHAEQLTPNELAQLGVIASGGGGVGAMLLSQAVWLYLKHAGKIEQALAATFAESQSPRD